MITVDKKNKTISLIQGSKALTFDLLVCYICPTCEKILLAYWRDDDQLYDPLWFLKKGTKRSKHDPYYVSFSVPGGKGVEARNHCGYSRCNYVYCHLILADNLKEFVKDLDYAFRETPIADITFIHNPSNHALIKILEEYGATIIVDICGREEPMLFFNPKLVIGASYYGNEVLIKKFLSVFGVCKKGSDQEGVLKEGEKEESAPSPPNNLTIKPASVEQVTQEGNHLLIPLVPLGRSHTTPLVITIIYDLLQKGVSIAQIREYFLNVVSPDLTKKAIEDYIEKYGRYSKPEKKETSITPQKNEVQRETKVDLPKKEEGSLRIKEEVKEKPKKTIVKQWLVKSNTDANKTYKVTKYSDGSFACSCRHWINKHTDCSHIRPKKRGGGPVQKTLF